MIHVYVSTDSREAAYLIEGEMGVLSPRHDYCDLTISRGEELVDSLGFNPMSYICIDNTASLASTLSSLRGSDLYVATVINGDTKSYFPQDDSFRQMLLSLALPWNERNQDNGDWGLFLYSNNLHTLNDFTPLN